MIHLRVLGSIGLRNSDGRDVRTVLAQPKRLALLAMLVTASHGQCRRDQLLGYFWPDHDHNRAHAALRQALRFLRRELGGGVISNVGNQGVWIDEGAVACDARDFERACDEQRPEDALDRYRGDLLPGLFVADVSPEFENWLHAERVRLHQRALKAAMGLVAHYRGCGQTSVAVQWARRAMDLAPEDERVLRTFLELLSDAGDCGGAIRAYETFAAALMRDLGIPPSALTQRLAATIRAEVARRSPGSGSASGKAGSSADHRPGFSESFGRIAEYSPRS
jgi:DNA-binding SARP family transcriptional activator